MRVGDWFAQRAAYDVCSLDVQRRTDLFESIVTQAPLLCIEVLSPRDSLREMQERVNDYFHMGVEHVWVVDPLGRVGYDASD